MRTRRFPSCACTIAAVDRLHDRVDVDVAGEIVAEYIDADLLVGAQ